MGKVIQIVPFVLCALGISIAQEAQHVKVPVTIGDRRFEIDYLLGTSPHDAAENFCIQQAGQLGITKIVDVNNCVEAIFAYMRTVVNPQKTQESPIMRVPLRVGGTQYELVYRTGSDVNAVAREFCIKNAGSLGLTTNEQLPNCITPVANYLRNVGVDHSTLPVPQIMKVPVTIAGQKYEIDFVPGKSAEQTAHTFCIGQANALNIVSNDQLPNCIGPVAEYLKAVLHPQRADEPVVLTVPLQIDGKNYEIKFSPDIESINSVAMKFCVNHASAIGITTDAQLPQCTIPVTEYLRSTVPKAERAKVQITVEGNPYEVEYTVGTPIRAVATEFCSQNAATFALKTESDVGNCVKAVFDYLVKFT